MTTQDYVNKLIEKVKAGRAVGPDKTELVFSAEEVGELLEEYSKLYQEYQFWKLRYVVPNT